MKKILDNSEEKCYTRDKIKFLLTKLNDLAEENANDISYELYDSIGKIVTDLEELVEEL